MASIFVAMATLISSRRSSLPLDQACKQRAEEMIRRSCSRTSAFVTGFDKIFAGDFFGAEEVADVEGQATLCDLFVLVDGSSPFPAPTPGLMASVKCKQEAIDPGTDRTMSG